LPPAWPVVSQGANGDFRVLWIGRDDGMPFPAPGGDPSGVLAAGPASLRYALTGREGVTALDIGRSEQGPGYQQLERTLAELIGGETHHAGALLAPFGIRYIVSGAGDLPALVRSRLEGQIDLDRVPALGLTIYRSPRPFPPAGSVPGDALGPLLERDAGLSAVAMLQAPRVSVLPGVQGGWTGRIEAGSAAYVADQYADGWQLRSGSQEESPSPAFGWALGFAPVASAGRASISYAYQWMRTAQTIVLALLWAGALWITRRPMGS
jgi:hypothetical protein